MPRPALSLYINPRGRTVLHGGGFSWLACVAVPLWALRRRAWALLLLSLPLGLLVHGGVLLVLGWLPLAGWQAVCEWVWMLLASWLCGRHVNEVHRRWLLWRGFVLTASEVPALWPAEAAPPLAGERGAP